MRVKHALRGPYWIGDTVYEGPPPPTLLHADTVVKKGDTWVPVGRSRRTLVGIVDLVNRTRYGFSSRGVPQYLFHPLDVRFPPFIVGSKAPVTANQWGLAVVDGSIQLTKDKWPKAALQELLGTCGDPVVEAAARRYQVLQSRPTKHGSSSCHDVALAASLSPEEVPEALVGPLESWATVLNIDPAGCRDVDDILCWRPSIIEDAVEVAVGIANVSAFVAEGSPLDLSAKAAAQTVYDSEGRVLAPMLPSALSEGTASLLADGVPRSVVAAVWTVRNGSAEGPTWRTFRVVNQATYTYESVLNDARLSTEIPRLVGAISGRVLEGTDPHIWIEAAMIAYNRAAATRLCEVGAGILRVQPRRQDATAVDMEDLAVTTGCREIAFLGAAAGAYAPVREGKDVGHAGLDVGLYCHASSPLRRYADLVNQRVLLGICGDACGMVAELNERAAAIKAFEREMWCLQHVPADRLVSAEGWVLGWRFGCHTSAPTQVRIYVPAWRRVVKANVGCLVVDEEEGSLVLENRDYVKPGSPVKLTAFQDLREARPEARWVFGVSLT